MDHVAKDRILVLFTYGHLGERVDSFFTLPNEDCYYDEDNLLANSVLDQIEDTIIERIELPDFEYHISGIAPDGESYFYETMG